MVDVNDSGGQQSGRVAPFQDNIFPDQHREATAPL